MQDSRDHNFLIRILFFTIWTPVCNPLSDVGWWRHFRCIFEGPMNSKLCNLFTLKWQLQNQFDGSVIWTFFYLLHPRSCECTDTQTDPRSVCEGDSNKCDFISHNFDFYLPFWNFISSFWIFCLPILLFISSFLLFIKLFLLFISSFWFFISFWYNIWYRFFL